MRSCNRQGGDSAFGYSPTTPCCAEAHLLFAFTFPNLQQIPEKLPQHPQSRLSERYKYLFFGTFEKNGPRASCLMKVQFPLGTTRQGVM